MTRFAALREAFDEENYLLFNTDVRDAIERGIIKSGFEHFLNFGYREPRHGVPAGLPERLLQEIQEAEDKIVIAGHSHTVAIASYRASRAPEVRAFGEHEKMFVLDGSWPRDKAYWQQLRELARNQTIVLVWGGNEHNLLYFFEEKDPFDFYSKHVERLIPGARIVPQRMIRKNFAERLKYLSIELRALVKAQSRQILLLGTPPPKKDNAELARLMVGEGYFQDWAERLGEMRIADPYKRLKLWYLLQEMFEEEAAKANVRFVAVPTAAQDEDGFLQRELWADDVTHGNAAYGQMMMDKLIAELGR